MPDEPTKDTKRAASGSWAALSDSLQRLQAAAQPAVVPGDLAPWGEPVAAELRAAREPFRAYGAEEREVRARILDDDLALAPRVEALEAAWAELAEELRRLTQRLEALLAAAAKVADDTSAEPTGRGEELRRALLAWIVAMRAHHGEVGTWRRESAWRERGGQQ